MTTPSAEIREIRYRRTGVTTLLAGADHCVARKWLTARPQRIL